MMMADRVPALRWFDGPDGRRLLFAGNGTSAVAEIEPAGPDDDRGTPWCFTVFLPGAPFLPMRPFASRSAIEIFAMGIVEGWFKEIYA